MVDGGCTLTPDDGYWMDKAIRISSAERSAILPGLSTARLHSLAKQNHIQTAPASHGFTFNLPEEHRAMLVSQSRDPPRCMRPCLR